MNTRGSAVVEIQVDQQAPTKHVLPAGSYVLGSAASGDLVVTASGVSRRHLQIDVLADGGAVLTDLQSSNGSRYGKRKITVMAITLATRLRLGDAQVTILPDSDEARVVGLPELANPVTISSTLAAPSTATDLPQTGWAIIQSMGDSLERLDRGESNAAVIASVIGRWSRLLNDAPLKIRSRQSPDAILAAVGDFESGDSTTTLNLTHGDLQLEIDRSEPALLSANRILALRTGLAALANLNPAATADPAPDDAPTPMPADVVSASAAMDQVYDLAAKVAKGSVSVLIHGESGSGKELLATWIHQQSPRRDGPFLAINCAALPAELLEAEIFGIERGIATGVDARSGLLERARGGTVFLDELGDMALPTQAKILRALESATLYRVGGSKPIALDVRFVAATHRRLSRLIAEGGFRLDLYHRIAAVELELPPLRQRRVDIALLATHFLATELAALSRPSPGITHAALAALCGYSWPGNVRELRNEMARAALLLQAHQALDSEHLSDRVRSSVADDADLSLEAAVAAAEDQAFAIALGAAGNDHGVAMTLLKLTRSSYFRRLQTVRERSGTDSTEREARLRSS